MPVPASVCVDDMVDDRKTRPIPNVFVVRAVQSMENKEAAGYRTGRFPSVYLLRHRFLKNRIGLSYLFIGDTLSFLSPLFGSLGTRRGLIGFRQGLVSRRLGGLGILGRLVRLHADRHFPCLHVLEITFRGTAPHSESQNKHYRNHP
ncbi:hypothetical protein DESC_700075 [Desulfosarcina cetonica]|nr:hypothetical protein DESC_700075 [Desulfosarcina cetonica]